MSPGSELDRLLLLSPVSSRRVRGGEYPWQPGEKENSEWA